MAGAETMNGLVDGVLLSVQERVALLENGLADLRAEVAALRRDFEAANGGDGRQRFVQAVIERRLDRIERRVNSVDLTLKQA